jgi:uncharacterized protein (TIGR03382 family)
MFRKLALLLLVGAAGCTGPAPVGERRAPIIGGTPDTGDPAVVLVLIGDPNTGMGAICTGEVVSPHVVLTAGHCVASSSVGASQQFQVFLGNNLDTATNRTQFIQVKEVHAHPDYSNAVFGKNDVGVVITAQALNIAPLPMNRTAIDTGDVGQTVRLIGYGVTSGSDSTGMTAGTKRQTTTTISNVTSYLIELGDATNNTCEGDSGGPALMTMGGVETIIGVTSFGDQGCSAGGADSRVDVYADSFVQPYIDANDPPPPDMTPAPIGAGGFPVGGIGWGCTDSSQCSTHICATQGASGFCTAACDPTQAGSCPTNTHCIAAGGANYCEPDYWGRSHGGCSAAGTGSPSALLVLLVVGAVAVARRLGRQKLR